MKLPHYRMVLVYFRKRQEIFVKTPLSNALDKKIVKNLEGTALRTAEILLADEEIEHLQDYATPFP